MHDPLQRIMINPDVCEGCGDCSMQSSCVSIEPLETKLGRKRKINQSTCNKDYTCLKGFCPSFVSVDAQLQARTTSHKIDGLPDPKHKVSDGVSNIILTGIGGTGVLTVSAITAMAAHYEGKESTILDMTGLAQKGGAVWSHIKIYEKNVKTFSHKIAPASANLFLACDAVVGTKPEIQEVLSDKKTYSIINSDTIPVADFVTNRDLDFKDDEVLKVIDKTTKDIDITVPAIKIAENLCGDAIAANIMMLGAAYQLGHVPLKEESIKYAIKLNGIGVEKNIYSFNLGRLYAFNPKDKIFKFLNSFKEKEQTTESVLEDRLERLAIYDKKEIDFFNSKVNFTKDLIKNELEIICVFTQPPKRSNRGQKILKSPVHNYAEKLSIEKFDLAISLGVLHHTENCAEAIRQIGINCVKSGGYFFIGLYHTYGRAPFLNHFKKLKSAFYLTGGLSLVFALFPTLFGSLSSLIINILTIMFFLILMAIKLSLQ